MIPDTMIVVDTIFVTVACLSIGIALSVAATGQLTRRVIGIGALMGVVIELGLIAFIIIYINHWDRWGLIAAPFMLIVIYLMKRRTQ